MLHFQSELLHSLQPIFTYVYHLTADCPGRCVIHNSPLIKLTCKSWQVKWYGFWTALLPSQNKSIFMNRDLSSKYKTKGEILFLYWSRHGPKVPYRKEATQSQQASHTYVTKYKLQPDRKCVWQTTCIHRRQKVDLQSPRWISIRDATTSSIPLIYCCPGSTAS